MDELELYHQNNHLYTQESLLRYIKGGYHPVSLGDTLDSDRYRIHHKLGFGSFSTVWLAEDTERAQWVSIKIITADATAHSRELDVIQRLKKLCPQGLSSRHIIQLLDNFVHHGPNGTHQCLVFELLGPTLQTTNSDFNFLDERLDSEVVLRISEQVLDALAFIHSSGYAHGDLYDRNIAFTCSGLAQATKEDLFVMLGEPKTEELKRLDGTPLSPDLPRQLVKTAGWDNWWINGDEEDIRILDFGEAFLSRAAPERLAQPGGLHPPETLFPKCFCSATANDLW